uniref:Uncharacterized protein n=1 Tax=Romanomermis culicivorax TaxID=13658 RepID=A0A915J601_ROMCU
MIKMTMQPHNNDCTHITYNGKNKFCFLQHADTKQQILDTRYDSYNYAWCALYSGEDRFVAEPSVTTMKPETAPIPDSILKMGTTSTKMLILNVFHRGFLQNHRSIGDFNQIYC